MAATDENALFKVLLPPHEGLRKLVLGTVLSGRPRSIFSFSGVRVMPAKHFENGKKLSQGSYKLIRGDVRSS
jgi:hypothetical protein